MNHKLPAFPTPYMDSSEGTGELYCDETGLTKLEYAAIQIISGLVASDVNGKPEEFAAASVKAAKALLVELGKDEGQP